MSPCHDAILRMKQRTSIALALPAAHRLKMATSVLQGTTNPPPPPPPSSSSRSLLDDGTDKEANAAAIGVGGSSWLTVDPWEATRRRSLEKMSLLDHVRDMLKGEAPRRHTHEEGK